jgi:hypothetical protein
MSLVQGTVTIDSSGVATGDGMARAVYDALLGTADMAALLAMQSTDPAATNYVSEASKVSAKRGMAQMATAIGDAVVAYLVAHGAVSGSAHVTSQSLGQLPTTLTAGQPIAAPPAPVDVPITGGIS